MMNTSIQEQDIREFVNTFRLSEQFKSSSFLITGATGLIGSSIVKCLLSLNEDIEIIIPVRSREKAYAIFGNDQQRLFICECELLSWSIPEDKSFDYIIHCASPTNGQFIVQHPVETYELAIETTRKLLNYTRNNDIKGFVYVSSIEYYGQIDIEEEITEEKQGYIDTLSVRSSYPLGKRAAEYLCYIYAQEYGVNAKVARLTQTFGAGVKMNDDRIFAQFARSIVNGTDIILNTMGESSKPYCYTTDCVSAILYIALKGEIGKAYNVANKHTYISIYNLALFVRENFNKNVNVIFDLQTKLSYAPVTKIKLSTSKLCELGWTPRLDLYEMFNRLIKHFQLNI